MGQACMATVIGMDTAASGSIGDGSSLDVIKPMLALTMDVAIWAAGSGGLVVMPTPAQAALDFCRAVVLV